jgi:predicted DNA-binding ribbon-helix-helix protein
MSNEIIINKMTTIIKELINEIWIYESREAQENFSSFLSSGIVETMEIDEIAKSEARNSSLIAINLIPAEEVWDLSDGKTE